MRMALEGDGQGVHGRATEGVGGKRWRDWEGDGVRSCTSGYVCTHSLTYLHTYLPTYIDSAVGREGKGEKMGRAGPWPLGWGRYIHTYMQIARWEWDYVCKTGQVVRSPTW